MNDKRRVLVSKFLAKHLRHEPEALGLTLQEGGWVPVAELLAACVRHQFPVTREELNEVVATNDKKRFAFDESGERIRANQGHSVEVDLQLEPTTPPDALFHGTAEGSRDAILRDGLLRMGRQHVHLSFDAATARKVGRRHGRPILFRVDAARMHADGHAFYVSVNGVWLTDHVPPAYLTLLPEDTP